MQRTEKSNLWRQSPARPSAPRQQEATPQPDTALPEYARLADLASAFGPYMPAAFAVPTPIPFSRAHSLSPRRESPI